ncbi:AMIN domain-containing protein [bacterium]|jgi:N-acetylmuramoyl-L-alanine amidase|nr:AMIN domain-containing protein [bacterium]
MLNRMVLFFILVLGTPLLLIASPKIHISENPIYFQAPLLENKDAIFVPLRELVKELHGKLNYDRKTNTYIITIEGQSQIHLFPNTTQYTQADTPKKLSHPSFMKDRVLYAPLASVLLPMGFQLQEKTANHFYIIEKGTLKQSKEAKYVQKDSNSAIFSLKIDPKPPIGKYEPLDKRKKTYIDISGKLFDITDRFEYFDNKLHVELAAVLKQLGYMVKQTDSTISLEKNGVYYTFHANSNQVDIQKNTKTKTKSLDFSVKFSKNQFLFPLHAMAHDLGFSLKWRQFDRSIIFLKNITGLTLTKKNEGYTIHIEGNPLIRLPNPNTLHHPFRLFWDIPQSQLKLQPFSKHLDHPTITRISAAQKGSDTRLVITSAQPLKLQSTNQNTNLLIPYTASDKPGLPIYKKDSIKKVFDQKEPNITKNGSKRANKALKNKVIAIDPGHGGRDPGALGRRMEREKAYTLDISIRLEKLLKNHGAKVLMARRNDSNPSLAARTQLANRNKADILISVHVNSFIKSYARGTETYYYKKSDKPLATAIQKEMVKNLRLKNNGVKRSMMYVLNHSTMPGALVEPCFITNPNEYKLIKTAAFRQKIALSIFNGIVSYFQSH